MALPLGVFSELYGDEMTIGRALLIAVVGFLLVFAILGVIALFVKGQGWLFDSAEAKKKKKQAAALAAAPAPAPEGPAAPAGEPLPESVSQGSLTLIDVSEEEAAMIMAIVAHESGIPLNRLEFRSIKCLEGSE
ncbi:MAG: OadG family protein [Clostridia bacterium]|nr:OadG family protein [Clostridia bacterium]